MAYLDSLTASQANIAATLASITASPKPSYSIDGQSISWTEYHAMLVAQLKELNLLIAIADGPFEYVTQGVS